MRTCEGRGGRSSGVTETHVVPVPYSAETRREGHAEPAPHGVAELLIDCEETGCQAVWLGRCGKASPEDDWREVVARVKVWRREMPGVYGSGRPPLAIGHTR